MHKVFAVLFVRYLFDARLLDNQMIKTEIAVPILWYYDHLPAVVIPIQSSKQPPVCHRNKRRIHLLLVVRVNEVRLWLILN